MNRMQNNTRGATCLFIFMMVTVLVSEAQKPEIKSVDKWVGPMEDVVILKGAFFGTDPTKIAVTFGASKADICVHHESNP